MAFQVLKVLGVAYLLFMAWSTLREKGALELEPAAVAPSAARVATSGVLINILNPKLTIFFFAFLPQFVSAADPRVQLRMVQLSAVFMLVTLVVFAAYGVLAAAVRTHVVSRPRVLVRLRRLFAASFVALGARLAVTER